MYASLPEEEKPGALNFQEMLKNVQPVEVDYTFSENEDVPCMNRIKIIHTPGHMPGHISIYLEESKILVSADAVVYEDGELEIANPHFTLDLAQAVESVKKFQTLDIEKIICYHGGMVEKDIPHKLSKLISRYSHQ
jgi:glyoxylase-like metal-dependent hydrolase (beta-lactamase superfamily II)